MKFVLVVVARNIKTAMDNFNVVEPIHVVIGLILNDKDQVLLTLRAKNASSCPSIWEFPGGKVEQNESLSSALIRELKEEVNISAHSPEYWFSKDDGKVHLHIFWVQQFDGMAKCLESQQRLVWADVGQLLNYEFPPSNKEIIEQMSKFDYSTAL